MKDVTLKITKNIAVAKDVYLMRLEGDTSLIQHPGEFLEIKLPNHYLRRPISVSKFGAGYVEILYKVLGHGTKDMTMYQDLSLVVLVGLGNGFRLKDVKRPLLIAGGIGIAPMFALAEAFLKRNIRPIILYGAAKSDDLVLTSELEQLGDLIICTDDGSKGYHGNCISYLQDHVVDYDYYYACGPQIMLKYLQAFTNKGCLSLEARMGCGFGACMGCSIQTTKGPKRVCKEGPVFEANEVIFE